MSESELVRKIIAWVKANGGDAWKIHGSEVQRSGEPDIDGALLVKGRFVHFKIECKVGSNTPSDIQVHRLESWARYGYCVGLAYTLDEFKQRMLDYDEREPLWTYAAYQNAK